MRLKCALFSGAVLVAVAAGAAISPYAEESVTGKVFGTPKVFASKPDNGMALALEGSRLYTGSGNVLCVWETKPDAMHPKLLGTINMPNRGEVRQLAVQDSLVYVTARESQVMIFDFRSPAKPEFLARYDCCELATGVEVAGNVLFVGQRQNGVEFVDITNPAEPRHIAMRKTDESQSVAYCDGFCYSGEWGSGRVSVFDCRDMANVRQVDCCNLYGMGDGVWVEGNRLYCATGHHSRNRPTENLRSCMTEELKAYGHGNLKGAGAGHGLDVFDISERAHPRHLGRVDFPPLHSRGSDWWTVRVGSDGKTAFCAQSYNGLFAVDVSDSAHPRTIDRLNFPPPARDKKYPSASLGSIAVGDGVVYVAGRGFGVAAVPAKGARAQVVRRGTGPKNASFREDYPNDDEKFVRWLPDERGQVRGVALYGDKAFVACGDAGLWRVKIAPGKLTTLGKVPGIKAAYDASVRSNRLVVAEAVAGWGFYELDDAGEVKKASRIRKLPRSLDFGFWCWFVAGNLAVLSSRNGGGYVLASLDDYTCPQLGAWLEMGAPGWNKYMAGDLLEGTWLAWNMGNNAFAWGKLENADKVRTIKSAPAYRGHLSCSPAIIDGKALMPLGQGYRLLAPGETVGEVRRVKNRASFKGLAATDGKSVLLSDRINREVSFYDFTDLENPVFLWAAKVSGNPDLGVVLKGTAFIPCGYQGLLMSRK